MKYEYGHGNIKFNWMAAKLVSEGTSPSVGGCSGACLSPGFLARGTTIFSDVLGIPEHQGRIRNLQCWSQLDFYHFDEVCRGQKQEGFGIYPLSISKQSQI